MNTKDVWTVFNLATCRILHIYAFEWQATKKAEWYWENPDHPKAHVAGAGSVHEKIEVKRLDHAINDIVDDKVNSYNYRS